MVIESDQYVFTWNSTWNTTKYISSNWTRHLNRDRVRNCYNAYISLQLDLWLIRNWYVHPKRHSSLSCLAPYRSIYPCLPGLIQWYYNCVWTPEIQTEAICVSITAVPNEIYQNNPHDTHHRHKSRRIRKSAQRWSPRRTTEPHINNGPTRNKNPGVGSD